tara:strand:- start:367 stop:471 length:105 start_codon:yes stop_codon:yes gene_type:complete
MEKQAPKGHVLKQIVKAMRHPSAKIESKFQKVLQ